MPKPLNYKFLSYLVFMKLGVTYLVQKSLYTLTFETLAKSFSDTHCPEYV